MDVLSNVVSLNNLPGSMQLMESNPGANFSEDVLNSAERYGIYLSSLLELNSTAGGMTIMANNICKWGAPQYGCTLFFLFWLVLNAQSVVVDDQLQSLTFPSENDLAAMSRTAALSPILERLGDGNQLLLLLHYLTPPVFLPTPARIVIPASVLRERETAST